MKSIKILLYKIRRYIFTSYVKLRVGEYKAPLRVNAFSKVSKKTTTKVLHCPMIIRIFAKKRLLAIMYGLDIG